MKIEGNNNENIGKEVIILNKPFLGGWLGKDGLLGHEAINFVRADDGEIYVYNEPWGVCPTDIWVEPKGDPKINLSRNEQEKYTAKYMVLTSACAKGKDDDPNSFDILYVIELAEKLHRMHFSKEKIPEDERQSNSDPKQRIFLNKEQIDANCNLMERLKVTFGGCPLELIPFGDPISVGDKFPPFIFLTFRASKIYKATNPIRFTSKEYYFARNKGYVWSDIHEDKDSSETFLSLKKTIIDNINNGTLVDFNPPKIPANADPIKSFSEKSLLDLVGMKDVEQVYTNMLYRMLDSTDVFQEFCERFADNKDVAIGQAWRVRRENRIVDGRMDICAECEAQKTILELKVFSGLNGKEKDETKTQLSKYYEWGCEGKKMEPLCFVIAPDFRLEEIRAEIKKNDPKMEPVYKTIGFSEIKAFLQQMGKAEWAENWRKTSLYAQFLDQAILSFGNYSYKSEQEHFAAIFQESIRSVK